MVKVAERGGYSVHVYAEAGEPRHRPHCHVRWPEGWVAVTLPDLTVLAGAQLPPTALELLQDQIVGPSGATPTLSGEAGRRGTAVRPKKPWDAVAYLRIVAASYGADELIVRFADGTTGRVDVERTTRVQAQRPEWPALTWNEYEVIVPTGEGDFEISSFGIRSLTDPSFHAHLQTRQAESARRVGQRIQELRQRRGLTRDTVAQRARIDPSCLLRIERGDHDGNLIEIERVVEAMGHGFKDLETW